MQVEQEIILRNEEESIRMFTYRVMVFFIRHIFFPHRWIVAEQVAVVGEVNSKDETNEDQ
jgi:hypothetical protein